MMLMYATVGRLDIERVLLVCEYRECDEGRSLETLEMRDGFIRHRCKRSARAIADFRVRLVLEGGSTSN